MGKKTIKAVRHDKGTVRWEVDEEVATLLTGLPPDERQSVEKEVADILSFYTGVIKGTLLNPKRKEAFAYLFRIQKELLHEIRAATTDPLQPIIIRDDAAGYLEWRLPKGFTDWVTKEMDEAGVRGFLLMDLAARMRNYAILLIATWFLSPPHRLDALNEIEATLSNLNEKWRKVAEKLHEKVKKAN